MRRAAPLLALIAVALALGLRSPGAEAHASLQRSLPEEGAVLSESPVEILLWFSESIEVKFSNGQVIGSDGTRYDDNSWHQHTDLKNAGIILSQEVPDGTYTVIWDVLSAVDGHRTKGAFAFFVGAPSAGGAQGAQPVSLTGGSSPPRGLEIFVRWLNFAAMAALLGGALFPLLILKPASKAFRAEHPDEWLEVARRFPVRASCLIAALVALAATLVSFWLQSWSAGGSVLSSDAMQTVFSETRFGTIWTVRIALVGGALACAVATPKDLTALMERSVFSALNQRWLLFAAIVVALPLTTSLNSHAAASGGNFSTAIDWLHLVAGGLWLGGLAQLLLVVAFVGPRLEQPAGLLGPLVRRFSLVAVVSVTAVIATGLVQSIERLGGIGQLVDTNYGGTLAVKIVLLLPLVALGAFNLLIVGPRLVSLTRDAGAHALSALWQVRLRLAVGAEITIAVAILIVTALLTNTSPPGPARGVAEVPQYTPGPAAQSTRAGDLKISLWVDPALAGANDVNVFLEDKDGDEHAIQRVIARLTYKDKSLGTAEVDLQPLHPPDHFVSNTSQVSLPGDWEVEVIVRREGVLDVRATFQISVQG